MILNMFAPLKPRICYLLFHKIKKKLSVIPLTTKLTVVNERIKPVNNIS